MQEHRFQSQRHKRGGRDMTSQHENFKSTFNSEEKQVVDIFWKQHF
jgi:hypothetical protein